MRTRRREDSSQPLQNIQPAANELEVSLFGPGVGECVVVHVGDGRWMIVDSCIDPETGNPVALDYLNSLKVDISTAVKAVVITHWHDDHTRGARRVLEVSKSAELVCSAALNTEQFWEVVAAAEIGFERDAPGIAEMAAIFELLLARAAGSKKIAAPTWVVANTVLYRGASTVHALSPASKVQSKANLELSSLLPQLGETRRRYVRNEANALSVALWVEFGELRALLGADLEAGSDDETGWKAIVNSTKRPPGFADIVKVPHHGSANADEPRMWKELVRSDAKALLTPFRRQALPRDKDLRRIRRYVPDVFLTAPARPGKGVDRPKEVERWIRKVALDLRPAVGPMGHVRFRATTPSKSIVELAGAALRVA